MTNMTAVEWLVEQLFSDNAIFGVSKELLEQAKAMEKEQIIDAAANHCYPTCELARIDAEQYYSETYKKDKDMATIYKVEVTSHWISYSKEELEKILTEAVKKIEFEKGNTIQIRVEDKK
jgi:hypothetical protein